MNNDLRVFCGGIADAIRTKKGTSDKINAQAFAEEILTIESGGGDGAVIEYGAVGTVVPNTGYVEKVYCNTNLSEEEVFNLLNALTYPEDMPAYAVINSENKSIVIMNNNGILAIFNENFEIYWVNEAGASSMGVTAGWQEFTNPIEINEEVLSGGDGVTVGEQNDLLTSLFSITPFGEKGAKTLTGTYDGTSIVANSNPIDISALIDEQKIPLSIKVPDVKVEDKVLVGNYDGTSIVATGDVDISALIDEQKIPLSIKVSDVKVDEKVLTGNYDGTAIEVTENGNVDISALIDEQKIPLTVNVDIPEVTVDEKVLVGNYDGSPMTITDNANINISALMDEQKIPLNIEVKEVVSNEDITTIFNGDY